jgi:thiamine pyrophosphokinase
MGAASGKFTLIITGGKTVAPSFLQHLPAFDIVIAADSGVDSALALGLMPHMVVGDLDSISPAGLATVRNNDIEVMQSPTDKDFTDTELALRCAAERGSRNLFLLSPGGGRLDHAHGVTTALFHPDLDHLHIQAAVGEAHVYVLHGGDSVEFHQPRAQLAALHAMNGVARGVTTHGLRWNLHNDDLEPWVSRGVSNEVVDDVAHVSVNSGALMVLLPLAYAIPNNHISSQEGNPS